MRFCEQFYRRENDLKKLRQENKNPYPKQEAREILPKAELKLSVASPQVGASLDKQVAYTLH